MEYKENILVARSSLPSFGEYTEEIRDIWNSHWLTNMGVKHNELQDALLNYLHVPCIELFTNGHMAIELSIQALGLNGEIITTPYTFASTTHAIVRNNCSPVFCDIDPETLTIDVNKIERLIGPDTVAILPVHVYGNVCDVEAIDNISKKHHLKVIYDAAHAFGEKYKNEYIGNFGDVSCFSFHATKVFNTIEGGAATYSNKDVGNKLYKLKNFGIQNEEVVDDVGSNAKMNEFCASMGLCNLRHVNDEIRKRAGIVNRYIDNLRNLNGISLNHYQKDVDYNYSYFPIFVDENIFGRSRDVIYEELKKENIYSRKYFYPIINNFDCYKNIFDSSLTPIAHKISLQVLTLPLYSDLSFDVVDKICEIISSLSKR